MGTLTGDEFVTEIQRELLNRTDVTATELARWRDRAYEHVSRPNVYEHRELQSTQDITLVANDRDYALDGDVDIIVNVYNVTQGHGLNPRDQEQFDRKIATTARPAGYSTWGTDLTIDNNPDTGSVGDTIRVRYWSTPTALTAGTATVIHERWDEIITKGAVFRGWSALGNLDRRDEAMDEFAKLISDVPNRALLQARGRGHRAEARVRPIARTK